MRVIAVAALSACLYAGVLGQGRAAKAPTIARGEQVVLLNTAERVASRNGDRTPYDIEAVLTTVRRVIRLDPGETRPACEKTPSCANASLYVVAMRGRFRCSYCSVPPGAKAPRGTVITLQIPAATAPSSVPSGFAIGGRYPDLRALGVPIRLRPAHRPVG